MKVFWALVFVFAIVVCEESKESKEDVEVKNTAPSSPHGDASQRTKLYQLLTKNYERHINPDNLSVNFGVALIDIDIDETKNVLDSNVWLRYVWKDSRLQWDEKEWGIDVLRIPSTVFWRPDIVLFNGADLTKTENACWNSNVVVYPSGEVLWVPPCHLTSYCKNTLKTHPYEDQVCTLKFGSWTYDANTLNVGFYNNETKADVSDFNGVSGWKIVDTVAAKNVRYYACCKEPYADLTFNITLRRRPESEALCKL